ncbi:hypothetical protein ARMGADRAFT_1087987 [Armillaria gallica]|uniref:Uncharacterized protein n=1 Tax=Armillaria gallica TaxID=47427 RepID=A0A2H3D6X0_ARMGA|nr:hypothetical protein ARMGADRAFT_1087987 [Armillaria gallica]
MGKNNKKKSSCPPHDLRPSAFPQRASTSKPTIIDTHTHLLKGIYAGGGVQTIVNLSSEPDVFMRGTWKELADGKWEGIKHQFAIEGVHPHEGKACRRIRDSHCGAHPSSVGLGEIGSDYHYMLLPPDVQQRVFAQQLPIAVKRGVPITVRIHCFTDVAAFGLCLPEYFPNLYIDMTGVICYALNLNAAELLTQMSAADNKRNLLETEAPYMVPKNVYSALELKQQYAIGVFVRGLDLE